MHLRGLSMCAPHSNGFGMGLEPFCLSQADYSGSDRGQPATGEFLNGDGLQEIKDAQTAAETCGATGGQDVVRAGGVIARGLGRVVADEDRTCVADLWQIVRAN